MRFSVNATNRIRPCIMKKTKTHIRTTKDGYSPIATGTLLLFVSALIFSLLAIYLITQTGPGGQLGDEGPTGIQGPKGEVGAA